RFSRNGRRGLRHGVPGGAGARRHACARIVNPVATVRHAWLSMAIPVRRTQARASADWTTVTLTCPPRTDGAGNVLASRPCRPLRPPPVRVRRPGRQAAESVGTGPDVGRIPTTAMPTSPSFLQRLPVLILLMLAAPASAQVGATASGTDAIEIPAADAQPAAVPVPDLREHLAACAICHGEHGEGATEGGEYFPHLAGKPAGYLLAQMQA